ncbi:MAG: hypothetical protein HRT88_01665 [Lentisphaeraceae bacterium]|nr:hypothetical protein [Lentisphaeraceae bacterium]
MINMWEKLPTFDYNPKKGYFRGWRRTVTQNAVRNYVVTKAYKQQSIEDMNEEDKASLLEGMSDSEVEELPNANGVTTFARCPGTI